MALEKLLLIDDACSVVALFSTVGGHGVVVGGIEVRTFSIVERHRPGPAARLYRIVDSGVKVTPLVHELESPADHLVPWLAKGDAA